MMMMSAVTSPAEEGDVGDTVGARVGALEMLYMANRDGKFTLPQPVTGSHHPIY